MTRVLVTGATGLLGKHAVNALLAGGLEVHGVARTKPLDFSKDVTWHECDLLHTEQHERLVAKIQATHLLHLAWVTEHGQFWNASENKDWKIASKNLIKAFQKNGGKRVVMAGSCAEYDWNNLGDGICQEEKTPLKPHTLYGQAKLETYQWLTEFAVKTDLSQAWGRVFLVFGNGEFEKRLVPSIAKALHAGVEAKCSSGTQVRDFMDAENAGQAFAALLMSDVQGAVNVATGTPRTIGDVARTLGEISGRPELIKLGAFSDRKDDPPVLVADVARLENEVGFIQTSDFRLTLKHAYDQICEGE